MTYLGAPAIAAACHVRPKTVYGWARGARSPIPIRKTASGRLWCTSMDIHRFFNPPAEKRDRIGLEVEAHLERLDRKRAIREKGGCHVGPPVMAPTQADCECNSQIYPKPSAVGTEAPFPVLGASVLAHQ